LWEILESHSKIIEPRHFIFAIDIAELIKVTIRRVRKRAARRDQDQK
jgi:hypothetical protein